jgi:hypothetical protein
MLEKKTSRKEEKKFQESASKVLYSFCSSIKMKNLIFVKLQYSLLILHHAVAQISNYFNII